MAAEPSFTRSVGSLTWLWDAGVVVERLPDCWHVVRVVDDLLLAVVSATADPMACCLALEADGVERALAIGRVTSPVVTSVCFGTLRVRWRQEATAPARLIGDRLWAAEAVGQFDIATLITAATALTVRLDARHRRPSPPQQDRPHV